MDNLLPDGEGKDLMKYLVQEEEKHNTKNKKIPVVSMSGNSVENQKEDYEGYEIQAFFQKPLQMENLKGLALLAK